MSNLARTICGATVLIIWMEICTRRGRPTTAVRVTRPSGRKRRMGILISSWRISRWGKRGCISKDYARTWRCISGCMATDRRRASHLDVGAIAETQAQRRADETMRCTDLIFEIALVREVHQLRVVDKEQEGGRISAHLRAVVKFQ